MKIILLSGWTTLEPKASYQIESISNLGYHITLITSDTYGRSEQVLRDNAKSYSFFKYPRKSIFVQQLLIIKYLFFKRDFIEYVICTPMSYTTFFTILICKFLNIKNLLLEWGSITDLSKVNFLLGFLASNAYKVSNKILYKEPHFKRILENLFGKTRNQISFLPNCIKVDKKYQNRFKKNKLGDNFMIDFLWANRPIWRRYPEYFLKASLDKDFENNNFRMYGVNNKTKDIKSERFSRLIDLINKKDSKIINLYSYELKKIFLSSKFFILASRDVYGNNSLLETMSLGIVPIVSHTPWTEQFVPVDSAIIFKNNYVSFKKALLFARNMTDEEYIRRSNGVVNWVSKYFSNQIWEERFLNIIKF